MVGRNLDDKLTSEEIAWSNDAIKSGRMISLIAIPIVTLGSYLAHGNEYGFVETNREIYRVVEKVIKPDSDYKPHVGLRMFVGG